MRLAIKPRPREEVREAWARVDRLERERHRQDAQQRLAGVGLLLRLEGGRSLEFRGRHYGVPPVPWGLAVQVLRAQEQLAAMQKRATVEQWEAFYREVGRLFKLIVVPRSRLERILWPLLPSPLRRATPVEVGQAMGFFSASLALDGAATEAGASLRPGTFQWTSPDSPSASPHGATNGGVH